MQELIRGLLSYARISSKTEPFVKVELNEIITQVCDDLALRIERTGASITVDPIPPIMADRLEMRQLFQNLIGNSLKYLREEEAPKITVSCETIKDQETGVASVCIGMEDNGSGFDPENREKIFDIFERLDADSTSRGSGIGLAICKKIVEHHRGTISADSSPGQGTKFTIILPIDQEKGQAAEAIEQP